MSNAKKKRVSLRGSKGTIQRVLKLIQPYRGLVLFTLLLAAVTVLTTLYAPILSGRGVDLSVGQGNVNFPALQEFKGVAVLEKRVVLYGGESNVSVFRSSNNTGNYCAIPEPVCGDKIVPEAVVEVLQPVVLGARIVERCGECHCCCSCNDVPVQITDTLGGALANDNDETFRNRRYLAVSLGLFSVVRLVRDGQFLIEAREYCIPEKECIAPAEDDPCGTFRKMPFPAAEFCPQSAPLTANNGRRSCCGS